MPLSHISGPYRRQLTLFLLLVFVVFPLTRQTTTAQTTSGSSDPVEAVTRMNNAFTKFGFELHAEVLKKPGGSQNVFISPSSIAWCLSMVLNGAEGKTRDEMAEALGVQALGLSDLNNAYAESRRNGWPNDAAVELDVANSLWIKAGLGILPQFLDVNRKYFGAEARELNFNDPASLDTINSWVKTKTRNKIDKIIDSIDQDSALFLINAIYFKGMWARKFDASLTREDSFTTGATGQKRVPMMRQNGDFKYMETAEFQAVNLPYGNGRLSMYVFLPALNTTAEFYKSLNSANWTRWMNSFRDAQGEIALPRFRVEYEITLNDALQSLGMRRAFDPQSAEFGAMLRTSTNAFISSVKHKAFAEVNEEGTEAAAATSAEVKVVSMPLPAKQFKMIVNRPFLFAIRDNTTGALLFLGSINDP